MSGSKTRDSGFELLRIIAMLGIIGGHYFSHGAGVGESLSIKLIYHSGLFSFGNTSVAIFLIISGWFVRYTDFSVRKLLKLIGEVCFYSLLCMFLAIVFTKETVTDRQILSSLFPISSANNWFAGTYICAYCFTPFIKKSCIYFHENRNEYIKFIGISFCVFVLFGFITPFNAIVSDFSWMIFLMYFGDSLRFFCKDKMPTIAQCVVIIVCVKIIEYLYELLICYIPSTWLACLNLLPTRLTARYSVGTLTIAVFAVLAFSQIHFFSKIINGMASTTFGIYLFHDNGMMYPLLWFLCLRTDVYIKSRYQAVHFFACIIIIFLVGMAIDLLRKNTVEKIWMRLVDSIIGTHAKHSGTRLVRKQ